MAFNNGVELVFFFVVDILCFTVRCLFDALVNSHGMEFGQSSIFGFGFASSRESVISSNMQMFLSACRERITMRFKISQAFKNGSAI